MAKEIKQIYQDWEKLGKANKQVKKPNYFIDSTKDTDYFKLREEIMTNIDKNNLIEYSSDIKCLIYDLQNSRSNRYETLIRFFNLYKNELMKFNIFYKGVLMLDITSYIGDEESEEFKSLVRFISGVSDGVIIFFISEREESKNTKMYEILSKTFFLERVSYKVDKYETSLELIQNICSNNNFKLTKESKNKIHELISNLIKNNENEPFKRLEDIFNKIIYKKIKEGSNRVISSSDFKEYFIKKHPKEVLRMF